MTRNAAHLRSWLFALDRFELSLRGRIGKQRNHVIGVISAHYAKGGAEIPGFTMAEHQRKVKAILTDHYERTIPYFGRWTTDQIKTRKMEEKALNDLFLNLMTEWISREALKKAKLISDTTRDDIQAAIDAGATEGLGVPEIARNIRRVSQLTPVRAATIARTETHQAATFASSESARVAEQELGVVLLKEWLPTVDGRTRPEHAAMASHPPIPLNEKFNVGGEEMDRPGDPSASAAMTVNCRCTMVISEAG